VRLAVVVGREVRGLSDGRPSWDASARDHDLVAAAKRIVTELLLGDGSFPKVDISTEDLPDVARITSQLKAVSREATKKHGGEAQIIVLAKKASASGRRQVMLANDGSASIVAAHNGVPTRHAADVLAELSCGDAGLSPEDCLAMMQASFPVSAPPADCRPTASSSFDCYHDDEGCRFCEQLADA
jgi:hypothetical protein